LKFKKVNGPDDIIEISMNTIIEMEKYDIDILGGIHLVKNETRQGFYKAKPTEVSVLS
jgi:hypothetical protein